MKGGERATDFIQLRAVFIKTHRKHSCGCVCGISVTQFIANICLAVSVISVVDMEVVHIEIFCNPIIMLVQFVLSLSLSHTL